MHKPFTENLATKDNIALVHKEMEALGKDIDALDTKVDTSFAALDTKIDTSNAAVQKDIKALDTKIDTSFAALDTKIDTSNAAVQKDIKALNTKIDMSFAALDTKIDVSIDKLRNGMTIRLGGIMVGVITALKLFENFVAN